MTVSGPTLRASSISLKPGPTATSSTRSPAGGRQLQGVQVVVALQRRDHPRVGAAASLVGPADPRRVEPVGVEHGRGAALSQGLADQVSRARVSW
jgi:hypothetical protein